MNSQKGIKDRRMLARPAALPQTPDNPAQTRAKQEADQLEMRLRAIYQAIRQTRSL
jgi:hypothetical protein